MCQAYSECFVCFGGCVCCGFVRLSLTLSLVISLFMLILGRVQRMAIGELLPTRFDCCDTEPTTRIPAARVPAWILVVSI